ncbi:MAG: TSUP family transporter, partial [Actinobacteria bacterium]|nr:TSUP family transporter [Actinomycetota bacterium]
MSHAPEQSKPSWLSLAGVGLAGGLFAGVFGVGGGLIMVPLLLWWTTLDQRRAHATSLLAITPVAIVGGVSYAVGGVFAWLPAIFVAIGGIFGAQIGAWLLRKIAVGVLLWGFIAFILASAVMLLIQLPDRSAVFDITVTSAAILFGLGVAMGISAGLFGIGGGVIVIPVLMVFFGQSDLVAKSISLLAMAPGAISGGVSHLRHNSATLRDGAWVAVGSLITTPLGAVIAFLS